MMFLRIYLFKRMGVWYSHLGNLPLGGFMAVLTQIAKEYKDIILGAHRNIRLFFLAAFLSQIGGGFFGILYNLYIKSLGLPDTVAGSYVSAGAIAGAISLVPAGIISDRFGRKRSIVSAGVFSSVIAIAQAFLQTPTLIVIGAFSAGLVSSMIWVSVLPLLAENTEKEERFHLFSVNFSVGLLAQVLGSIVAGGLAQFLGHVGFGPVWSLRLTLLTGAVIGFIALIPFSKIQEVRKGKSDETLERSGLKATLRHLRADKAQMGLIAKFTLATMFIGFGAGLVIPYLNLYFAERFQLSKAHIGFVIALAQAATAAAMFIGPTFAKRVGPVKAVVALQLSSIPFLLITGWMMNVWLVSGAVVIRNALMNSGGPIQDSIMMALVSEKTRGLAVSSGQTMFTLGWAIMGPISTRIVHHYGSYTGYAIVFSGTAILYLAGSIYYGMVFYKYEHKVYTEAVDPVSV
jgi:MFS family permease